MAFGIGGDAKAILNAMAKSQAIIEFDMTGKILTANENFCQALGYQLREIVGQHHRMFVDPVEASSSDYRAFWDRLGQRRIRSPAVSSDRKGRPGNLDRSIL